ncbi:hypothetical protein PMAYCL1PPCAC_15328, partial [Pristionchus mayeri]
MNSSNLRYEYHLDRDYFVPFMQLFQPFYGVAVLPMHCIAFFLLLRHTRSWATNIKIGYHLTQLIMFAHDVWTCFFFRGYELLPNPIAMCTGIACRSIGPYNALAVEHIFMIHAVTFFQFWLFMMQQQVASFSKTYALSRCAFNFQIAFLPDLMLAFVRVASVSSLDIPDASIL